MKIKVAELEGAKLNYWVARAEGKKIRIIPSGLHPYGDMETEVFFSISDAGYFYTGGFDADLEVEYSPSADWSQGGPIIEREHITLDAKPSGTYDSIAFKGGKWIEGPTPLIAAMRCYVASKFGEEVEELSDASLCII
jgi:hypothetical protein